ncbi:MAG: helix-turn-helix domain-containing protein [Victivallales bacterium]
MAMRYNWSSLVREVMDVAFLPQVAMAEKLGVCQQSISNWLNATRNPSPETIPALLRLAQDSGMDIKNYEANPEFDEITAYMKKNKARELVRLFDLYVRMSKASKLKFIRYAERLR